MIVIIRVKQDHSSGTNLDSWEPARLCGRSQVSIIWTTSKISFLYFETALRITIWLTARHLLQANYHDSDQPSSVTTEASVLQLQSSSISFKWLWSMAPVSLGSLTLLSLNFNFFFFSCPIHIWAVSDPTPPVQLDRFSASTSLKGHRFNSFPSCSSRFCVSLSSCTMGVWFLHSGVTL